MLQEWINQENLWELTDPETPTHRAGTVTDGMLLAPGTYMPEGILPQGGELTTGKRQLDVHPVHVTEELVLADNHALFLDLIPKDLAEMPRLEKYKIHGMTELEWSERNQNIEMDSKFQNSLEQVANTKNAQQNYAVLLRLLKRHFRNKLRKHAQGSRKDATEKFEKKFAQHDRFPEYQKARDEHRKKGWINIQDEILRSD